MKTGRKNWRIRRHAVLTLAHGVFGASQHGIMIAIGKNSWDSAYTYVSRDILLKGQPDRRENNTPADVFDSISFRAYRSLLMTIYVAGRYEEGFKRSFAGVCKAARR